MATGGSYVQNAEEDLICPLCLELFIDPHIPKLLDCPHVYCQICLIKLLDGSKGKQTFSCPECRNRTTVPAGKVANLKTVIRLRNLAEKHAKHQQLAGQSENFKIYSISYKCKDHDGEKLHFYCLTCQVSVCQACLVLVHERPKHEIKSVKDVYLEKVATLKETIKRNERLISNFRKNVQNVTRCEQKIQASVKASENEIDRAVTKAINDIETQAIELKQNVRLKNVMMLQKCMQQKVTCEKKANELQNAVEDAKKILEIKAVHKYLEHHKNVTKQFKNLEAKQKAQMPVPKDDIQEYHLHDMENDDLSNVLKVASYGCNDKLLVHLGSVQERVVRKLKLQETASFPYPITSVACGSDHVVVNMQSEKLVEVYKHNAGKLHNRQCRLAPTERDWYPLDVAITKAGRILVTRWNCIEEFSFYGKHDNSISLNHDSTHESVPCSVITTEDQHILAGYKQLKTIACYSSDGKQCLSYIWTPFVVPRKLVSIGDNYVAVSDLGGRVCTHLLSRNSHYGVYPYNLFISISNPTALCYDKETECLLIGSQDVNAADGAVIEQYCWKTGAKIATIAHGLKDPQDMALTDDGQYLVVADEKALKFYKISAETITDDGKVRNQYNSIFPNPDYH